MNTERVKNILIVMLGVITLVMAVLIYVQESRYTLSGAQETAIISLLAQNDIHFDARYMVRDFRPMRQLAMGHYTHDREELAIRFFGRDQEPDVEIDGHDMIYSIPNKYMIHSDLNNAITFYMPGGFTNEAFAASPGGATAEQLAREFIEQMLGMPPDMERFSIEVDPLNNWIISLFTVYRGYMLYNDHIRVRVTYDGITSVFYSRTYHHGFTGETHSIFSGDEALLALLNHLHRTGVEGHIRLTDMRLAYFLIGDGENSTGVPAYVFTLDLGLGVPFNYLFNAFTNEFITHEIIG
ncbi:MAG: hypothetical protein FWC93_00480 [Defluviitaleaceae bacterium]|nr:hypothetical protein [Defluviitaleaceae bacterium]